MLSSFSWLGTEIQNLQLFSKLCRRQYVCATLSCVGCGCINKRLKCGVELHSDISLRSNTHSLRCGVKPQNKKVGKQTTRKPFQLPRPCFHDGTGTRPPTSLPFPNFPILPKLSTFTNIPWPPATFLFHQFKDHTYKEKRGKLRESMIRNRSTNCLPPNRFTEKGCSAHQPYINSRLLCNEDGYPALYSQISAGNPLSAIIATKH